MENKRNTFKGSIGFVLAAAGSAVGLGNIWRFPYLAAKDGGGLFLVIYIILALTFGFSLLSAEIAIGRKTKKSPLLAYSQLNKKFSWLGVLACIIPAMILPYYCAIGGWVVKYFTVFVTGQSAEAAVSGYFGAFIESIWPPIIMFVIFFAATAIVVFRGVNRGIESFSKFIMPALFVLIIIIAVFSLTLSYTDSNGIVRTGLEGFKILVVPDFSNITLKSFFGTLTDALGQLFYSLSIAMGIMIAYGSYVKDDVNMPKSISQIEFFDSAVAFLAGTMIIPAVFTFSGRDGMAVSGPSLMFVELPKVFNAMGFMGNIVGALFFAMVLFAAVTSSVSIMEAIVSSIMEKFKWSRTKSVIVVVIYGFIMGLLVCLGYNVLFFNIVLPNGSNAQILDILDYISNYLLMPIVAIATCILVGWVVKPKYVVDEIEKNGKKLKRAGMLSVMLRFIAPVLLFFLLLISLGVIQF